MGLNLDSIKNFKKPEMNEQQKGLFKLGAIAVIGIVAVIIIFVIIRAIIGTKVNNTQLENIMVRAAQNYVEDNPDKITSDIYGETSISISTLISGGYMKEMTKYKGKDTNCNGSVTVFKNVDYYSYSPKLTCGSDYTYETLYSKITAEENIVTEDSGLYYEASTRRYVFKGEYANNYVTFANQTWLIMNIDEEGNLHLIQLNGTKNIVWDDRYNNTENREYGINSFEGIQNSRIKDSILDYYNNEEVFTSGDKSVIIPDEYCVGERTIDSSNKSGEEECMVKSELMGAGLPIVSDVMNASLDENCIYPDSKACSNYNYFVRLSGSFWTSSPYSQNDYSVFYVSDCISSYRRASQRGYMNIVIKLNGNINYTSGTGTETDPYVIKVVGAGK